MSSADHSEYHTRRMAEFDAFPRSIRKAIRQSKNAEKAHDAASRARAYRSAAQIVRLLAKDFDPINANKPESGETL